jgi:hypothetical protein
VASAEIMVNMLNLPEVRALIDATISLIKSRNAGADVYEAGAEVEAIEKALDDLGITISRDVGATWNEVRGYVPS